MLPGVLMDEQVAVEVQEGDHIEGPDGLGGGGDESMTPVEEVTGTLSESDEIGTARRGMDTCTFDRPPMLAVRFPKPATFSPRKTSQILIDK